MVRLSETSKVGYWHWFIFSAYGLLKFIVGLFVNSYVAKGFIVYSILALLGVFLKSYLLIIVGIIFFIMLTSYGIYKEEVWMDEIGYDNYLCWYWRKN